MNTKKTLAMLAPLATIGATSLLSLLVITTTPIYAAPTYAEPSSYQAYCYSREHSFGEDPVFFCAYGTGAEQLCEQQQYSFNLMESAQGFEPTYFNDEIGLV